MHAFFDEERNNTIKRRVKEAIAVKRKKPSLKRDEGMGLPAIYNPLLGIRNNLSVA